MVQTRFSKFFPRQEIVHKQGIIEPQRMIRYALITSGDCHPVPFGAS